MKQPVESQLTSYGQVVDDAISTHLASAEAPGPQQTRLRLRVLAPLAIGALALVAVMFVLPSSEAWAGWTPATQASDPADVAALDDACRTVPAVADLPALAFDVRGEGGAAIYGDEQGWASCHADRTNSATFRIVSVQSHTAPDLDVARAQVGAEHAVVTIALSWHQGDDPASLVWGVNAPSVAAIEIGTGQGPVAASVVDDIWVAWWPGSDAESAEVLAFDPEGRLVLDEPASALAASLPSIGEIVSSVEQDGTELARAVLSDGTVTWAEFRSGLAAWQSCVAEAGYELTIEIDEDAQTYRAISPTVSVAAERGQPDDLAGEALLQPIVTAIESCYASQLSPIARVYVQQ